MLHNKENKIFDSYETMKWGCGKMMPQGLNEAIVAIRFIQTIEILRPELEQEWLENVHRKLFREMFRLLGSPGGGDPQYQLLVAGCHRCDGSCHEGSGDDRLRLHQPL